MTHYSSKEPFSFKIFKTIRSIYSSKITINEANE